MSTNLLSLLSLVHLIGKPYITNEWSQYINTNAASQVQVTPAPTSKAVVKLARNRTPNVGTTIAHISLADREPENAIFKVSYNFYLIVFKALLCI